MHEHSIHQFWQLCWLCEECIIVYRFSHPELSFFPKSTMCTSLSRSCVCAETFCTDRDAAHIVWINLPQRTIRTNVKLEGHLIGKNKSSFENNCSFSDTLGPCYGPWGSHPVKNYVCTWYKKSMSFIIVAYMLLMPQYLLSIREIYSVGSTAGTEYMQLTPQSAYICLFIQKSMNKYINASLVYFINIVIYISPPTTRRLNHYAALS